MSIEKRAPGRRRTSARGGWRLIAAASAALIAMVGCGGPDVSTSSTEAVVSGTVTIRGKPATGGSVVFDPSNVKRRDAMPRSAEIGPDGRYSITTLVGGNVVSLSGSQFDQDAGVGTFQAPVDVQAGENSFDVVVP